MKNIMKKLLLLSIGVLFLTGCGANRLNTDKIIEDFEKNKTIFNEVAQYISKFDYTPYEKEIGADEAIHGSFAVSDFKELNKYVMVIEAGPFLSSTFYKEVTVPEDVLNRVEEIFNLRYAFICQVNARDEEQIVYFRVDDIKNRTDKPHGIAYSQGGNPPKDFSDDGKITMIKPIDENWYYFEQESAAEYESEK